jgi:two-component system chemotaxis response regulator CheB
VKRTRVLIVDDSSSARALLRSALEAEGDILVVAETRHGPKVREAVLTMRPDLVAMELSDGANDGLATVEWMMAASPRPILIVSALASAREQSFEAIRRGALDVAAKPARADDPNAAQLRQKVRALAKVPVVRHVAGAMVKPKKEREETPVRTSMPWVVGVGASAGGPGALATVCAGFPRTLPACVAIVQHLPSGFAIAFAAFLQSRLHLRVVIARDPMPVEKGIVVLAPDDAHLELDRMDVLRPTNGPKVQGHRPSADVLLSSIARVRGRYAVGAILSGMGRDGAVGLGAMHSRGALTIAQDEATSPVYGMPRAAVEAGAVQVVLPIHTIAPAIISAVARPIGSEGAR